MSSLSGDEYSIHVKQDDNTKGTIKHPPARASVISSTDSGYVPGPSSPIKAAPGNDASYEPDPTITNVQQKDNIKKTISWNDSTNQDQNIDNIQSQTNFEEVGLEMDIQKDEERNATAQHTMESSDNAVNILISENVKSAEKDAKEMDKERRESDGRISAEKDAKEMDKKRRESDGRIDSELRWLQWVKDQFDQLAGNEREITYQNFKSALKVKESFFAEKFFDYFDTDGNGTIQLLELMDGLRKLTRGSTTDKIKFLFNLYDLDGNGYIDIDELKTVLESCVQESSIKMSDFDMDRLTEVLFDAADTDNSGTVTFEELQTVLEQHPEVLENLTISASQWLKPGENETKKEMPRYLQMKYIKNNLKKIIFFFIFLFVNIGLYTYGALNYRESNAAIIIARGSGMCLNFNCVFILVLMLRKCITWLRSWHLAYSILPLDHHIMFHKLCGIAIVIHSCIHTFAHIGNAVILSESGNLTVPDIIFTTKANIGWVAGSAPITGVILVIILTIMVICSMPFVRRSGHFEVFYYTHMLYIPFWILCIIHGTNFWKWFIVPGIIFFFESILRSKPVKLATFGRTYIKEVNLLPSGVTHLKISRPANFEFKPGDYLFIQIPVLARYEWHPFTISSAPEMEGFLWLHIRSAGHWTKSLYEYFEKYKSENKRKSTIRHQISIALHDGLDKIEKGIRDASNFRRSTKREQKRKSTIKRRKDTSLKVNIEVYLDGPYGTSTREIFQTEHAVLIASGIGVTPYASILQSIICRFNAMEMTCPECRHVFTGAKADTLMKLKKVDFVWINRDQRSFEWLISLLTQLELEQVKIGSQLNKILDLHMYMTAAVQKSDMKGIGLQVALDLIHEKEKRDLLTGLRTKTNPGRPDFNELFKSIAAKKQGKVKVYFCGAPVVGKTIKEYCEKFKFGFRKENF